MSKQYCSSCFAEITDLSESEKINKKLVCDWCIAESLMEEEIF